MIYVGEGFVSVLEFIIIYSLGDISTIDVF